MQAPALSIGSFNCSKYEWMSVKRSGSAFDRVSFVIITDFSCSVVFFSFFFLGSMKLPIVSKKRPMNFRIVFMDLPSAIIAKNISKLCDCRFHDAYRPDCEYARRNHYSQAISSNTSPFCIRRYVS